MQFASRACLLVAASIPFGLMNPWAAQSPSPAAAAYEGFKAASFLEVIPLDDARQLGLSVFLSGPLVDDSRKEIVRQVVITETFETLDEGRILSRACLFKAANPLGAESIQGRYSVANVLSGSEADLPVFVVEVVPKPGLNWQDVTGFDDLLVAAMEEPK